MKKIDLKKDFKDFIMDEIIKRSENLGISITIENLTLYGDNIKNEDIESLNIFIKLDLFIYSSAEKYQFYDVNNDRDFYKGEDLALKELTNSVSGLNKIKYKDVDLNFKISIVEYDNDVEHSIHKDLNDLLRENYQLRIEREKLKLKESNITNIFNSEEARIKFQKLAEAQRNKPENQMRKVQRTMMGGVLSHNVEHIGDLTHRISQAVYVDSGNIESSINDILPKINNGIRSLTSEYGFEKEHNENVRSAYNYYLEILEKRCTSFSDFKKKYIEENTNKIKNIEIKKEKIIKENIDEYVSDLLFATKRDMSLKKMMLIEDVDLIKKEFENSVNSNKINLLKELLIKKEKISILENELNNMKKDDFKNDLKLKRENENLNQIKLLDKKIKETLDKIENEKEIKVVFDKYNDDTQIMKTKYSSFEKYNKDLNFELNEYSRLHSELPVYNEIQYHCREAAITLGLKNFNKTIEHLNFIKDAINNETFIEMASMYDLNFDENKIKINKSSKMKI